MRKRDPRGGSDSFLLVPGNHSVLAGTLQNGRCSFREMLASEGPWTGGLEMAPETL